MRHLLPLQIGYASREPRGLGLAPLKKGVAASLPMHTSLQDLRPWAAERSGPTCFGWPGLVQACQPHHAGEPRGGTSVVRIGSCAGERTHALHS